jgi:hypothetical protein
MITITITKLLSGVWRYERSGNEVSYAKALFSNGKEGYLKIYRSALAGFVDGATVERIYSDWVKAKCLNIDDTELLAPQLLKMTFEGNDNYFDNRCSFKIKIT